MKVVGVSNHGSETTDDILVCENVSEFYGKKIVEALNESADDHSRYFFKLVDDAYELYEWTP
jgi:hypothetical protein